jgi:RND family efflux transporter MFP subunit
LALISLIKGNCVNDRTTLLSELKINRDAAPPRVSWTPWIIGALILLLVAGGLAFYLRKPAPIAVKTAIAQNSAAQSASASVLDATGYVVARRSATVSSKVTGKVVEVLIEEGMRVEKDQVLARLDDLNAKKSIAVVAAEVQATKAQVAEIRARLDEAELNYNRNRAMVEKQLVSQASFDLVRANYEALKAQLATRLESVHVSESLLAQQQQFLDDLTIRAPFAGVVISKDSQPGEMISPVSAGGGFTRTGICTLVDMASLEIEVDVNESYIQRVREGQPAEAVLEAYPEFKFPAKVTAIIPTADRQKATVKVRIAFLQLDARILPDMGVKVAFLPPQESQPQTAESTPSIRVPEAAIFTQNQKAYIWVVNNYRVSQRAVVLGTRADGKATISSGLSAGEEFVVSSSAALTDGDAVMKQ